MITIHLTDEETVILHRILEENIEDLRTEVHHTDSRDYREMLIKQEDLLKRLLKELDIAGEKVLA